MKLTEIINSECVALNKTFPNKKELFEFIIDLADKSELVLDKDLALKDVLEREKVLSTGIGKGIALPHAKTNAVQSFVVSIVTLSDILDYDSLDSEPVRIVILLLGPEGNIGMNLKILSKISKILNNEDFRRQLTESKTSEEVIGLFKRYEE